MFSHVAESRSFTIAAQHMSITPAGVSKGVTRLEVALGVKLLNRSTRSVSLTDDGKILLTRWIDILSSVQETENEILNKHDSLRGKLKIHAPVGFGRKVLMTILMEMAEKHPNLIINADFSDRIPNIIEDGFDIMIKIGDITDSRLIAKKIANLRYVTCATPAYLEKKGTPLTPLDLEKHNCITYTQWQTGDIHKWTYEKEGQKFFFTPSGNISINHPEAILDAALSGCGVARMASFIAASSIIEKHLQMILTDWIPKGPEIQIIYQPSKFLSPRVRAFIQCVGKAMPSYLPWERSMGLPAPKKNPQDRFLKSDPNS